MITAKIKSGDEWKEYKTCSLGISLQSKNHIGDNLQAMVNWVNAVDHFTDCVVDLSDTLHRHNLVLEKGISYEEAHRETLRLGDIWIADNQKHLDTMKIPCHIIRWDHWLDHAEFEENKQAFYNAFSNDITFRQSIFEDVGHYFDRAHKLSLKDVPEEKIMLSAAYLIEELAAHALFFDQHPCATIYPGRHQASFKMVRNGLVKDVPQGMTKSCFVSVFLYDIENKTEETPAYSSERKFG